MHATSQHNIFVNVCSRFIDIAEWSGDCQDWGCCEEGSWAANKSRITQYIISVLNVLYTSTIVRISKNRGGSVTTLYHIIGQIRSFYIMDLFNTFVLLPNQSCSLIFATRFKLTKSWKRWPCNVMAALGIKTILRLRKALNLFKS